MNEGNIYKDFDSEQVIGKFPAYVNVPATKKIVLTSNAADSVFYKITYKEYTGWVNGKILTVKPKPDNKRKKTEPINNKKAKEPKEKDLASFDSKLIVKKINPELKNKPDVIFNEKEITNSQPKKYFVQAGSFKDLSQAKSLKTKLSNLGIENVSISRPLLINSTTWYRVYLDTFDNYRPAIESSKVFTEKYSIVTTVTLENWGVSNNSDKPEQTKVENNLVFDYYTLQLNSVENLTMAKLLVDKYDVMGLETEITITEISDITRYRVRYGKFDRIAKAQTAAKFLKDKYNLDSWADNVYK